MGKDDAAFPSWVQSSICDIETATHWMRLSVAAPLPNANGGTGGGGQNNVLRVLWRYYFHYKVKTDSASHVMSD